MQTSLVRGEQDLEPIVHLKLKLRHYLDSHFRVSLLHHVAILLDPRLKANDSLQSPAERESAIAHIRELISEVPESSNEIIPNSGIINKLYIIYLFF